MEERIIILLINFRGINPIRFWKAGKIIMAKKDGRIKKIKNWLMTSA